MTCWLRCSSFSNSDQVLSITPKTQEQVDVLKNVSTQYEVIMGKCTKLSPLWRLVNLSLMKPLDIFSQTALWQPVSSLYIKEETVVHLFVPANSSEMVKDLLQKNAITHEYVCRQYGRVDHVLLLQNDSFASYVFYFFLCLLF